MSSNQLLVAGLLSALGLGGAGLAAVSSKSGKSSRARTGRGGGKRVVSSGLGGMNPVNSGDLRLKPPSDLNVPMNIPRNIPNMVVWDSVKIAGLISQGGAGLVEQNFIFTITLHPQYASWLTLFDQYCIVQATVEFDSVTPPGQTYSSPQIYTAIDFDSAANIGTVSAIGDFASSESIVLAPEKRHMRSVRPCCKATIQSSGTSAVNAGVTRQWIDSTATTVQHYGIRSICTFVGAGAYSFTQTIYFAFRNQI
jgi:hypothetical protein